MSTTNKKTDKPKAMQNAILHDKIQELLSENETLQRELEASREYAKSLRMVCVVQEHASDIYLNFLNIFINNRARIIFEAGVASAFIPLGEIPAFRERLAALRPEDGDDE